MVGCGLRMLRKSGGARFLRMKQVPQLAFCIMSDMLSNKIKCTAVYLEFFGFTKN